MIESHLGEFCPCKDKYMHILQSESGSVSHSVLSDSLPPHGLEPAKFLCPWETWETQLDPWVRKIPWRRVCQPTPVFLPRESHGQRSLAGYDPWEPKESDRTEWLTLHTWPPSSDILRNVIFFKEWERMDFGEKLPTLLHQIWFFNIKRQKHNRVCSFN